MLTENKKIGRMCPKKHTYDYETGVVDGKLCKECNNDKTCKDKKCPVHKFRKD